MTTMTGRLRFRYTDGSYLEWSTKEPTTPEHVQEVIEKFAALDVQDHQPSEPPCTDHKPVQHRDGKPPWCKRCGLTAGFTTPVSRFDRQPSEQTPAGVSAAGPATTAATPPAGYQPTEQWVTAPDGEQFRVGACQGHAGCPVEKHEHGCFADTGNCDHPADHQPSGRESEHD